MDGAAAVGAFSGLHCGARIDVHNARLVCSGGVACLLKEATEEEPCFLLTAGHLFCPGELSSVTAALNGAAPQTVGRLKVNLLDTMPSCGFNVDAALVELERAGRRLALASNHDLGPDIRRSAPLDEDSEVILRCPTSNAYSACAAARWGDEAVALASPARPDGFAVYSGIETECISEPGDSGSCLVRCEELDAGVGLCSGAIVGCSVFEPLSRALPLLAEALGRELSFWSPPFGGSL